MAAEAPLAGRTVALVHPAWASCGTATVVASQARAYHDLGARVVSVALSDHPGFGFAAKSLTRAYLAATPELIADQRLVTGISPGALLNPAVTSGIAWDFAHGDFAATYVALAAGSAVPAKVEAERIDLVHCNHFFCMPLAEAVRAGRGTPLLLETHDIQAKQYLLRNRSGWYLRPRATEEAMLATELHWLARADLLIHLNAEEDAAFRELLPPNRHALQHPAVEPMPAGAGAGGFLIVPSGDGPDNPGRGSRGGAVPAPAFSSWSGGGTPRTSSLGNVFCGRWRPGGAPCRLRSMATSMARPAAGTMFCTAVLPATSADRWPTFRT